MTLPPICTTEINVFSKATSYFEKLNTCLLGLNVDSNSSHLEWIYDTVRNVFIIDDKGIVRLILVYPMNVGRCIPEILRSLTELQIADSNKLSILANLRTCQLGILPPPQTFDTLETRKKEIEKINTIF